MTIYSAEKSRNRLIRKVGNCVRIPLATMEESPLHLAISSPEWKCATSSHSVFMMTSNTSALISSATLMLIMEDT